MPPAETSFDLVNRFHIDDGELNGLTPEDAFVLGVEWEMVRQELLHEKGEFSRPVHVRNLDRLLKLAWNLKRRVDHEIMTDEWVHFHVLA
jgi:hypothetical protein